MINMLNELVLRTDRPTDEHALRQLAALDSVRPIKGRALLAEIDGRAIAAIGIDDGKVVADPFRHTAEAVELLRVRAERLDPRIEHRQGLRNRFRTAVAA